MNTEAARCASLIRKDLKKAYPTTKFSVTSSNFSMGNSVDISWTDGPTQGEVDTLLADYVDGYFDGMTDCYNYTSHTDEKPRTKYLSCNRTMSKEFEVEVCLSIEEPLFGREYEQDRRVYALFRETNWEKKQKLPTPEERYAKQEAEFAEYKKNNYKIVVEAQ